MKPNVVDLSHHNGVNDFVAVKDFGILGVIHKATQSTHFIDPMYHVRRRSAFDAGLLWGAYHFLTSSPVGEQARHFLNVAQPDARTLVAVDYENSNATPRLSDLSAFCAEVEQSLGRNIVVYSGNLLKETLLGRATPEWQMRRLWLAQYGPRWHMGPLEAWSEPWLWQYSERGSVPGLSGDVDLDFFDGDESQLDEEWAS